jgi:hypothetical protein
MPSRCGHRTTYPTSDSVRAGIMLRRSHTHPPRWRQMRRSSGVLPQPIEYEFLGRIVDMAGRCRGVFPSKGPSRQGTRPTACRIRGHRSHSRQRYNRVVRSSSANGVLASSRNARLPPSRPARRPLLDRDRSDVSQRCVRGVPKVPACTETSRLRRRAVAAIQRRCSTAARAARPVRPRLVRRACPCQGSSTSLSPKRKRSITGSVRCIWRISACVRFEIFHVGPAGRYIMLQNRMCACLAVGYSGVYGEPGPYSRRRR